MAEPTDFSLHLWGTRGSLPTPGADTVRYGGNTTTFEIRAGERFLMIDAGSGARGLGQALAKRGVDRVNLFFTHTHFDHICGLPFFAPLYIPTIEVAMWAGHLADQGFDLKTVLEDMMIGPLFPVPLTSLAGASYRDFSAGERFDLGGGVIVETAPLNHPNGATGYRVEYGDRAIAIVTDTEHPAEGLDANVMRLARDADVMVYDAMYTDASYANHVGWGHSTWQKCLEVAAAAGVSTPIIFHHDPGSTDDALDAIAVAAAARYPGALVAREGTAIYV